MPFPRSFMDELTARNDIVDLVGSYVTLSKRGGDYWACCPFHNEKTPSFHVLPERQMYYCFGCKKGGDAVHFIMEIENLPFPDAVAFLAKRAGMEVPDNREDQEQVRRRARLLALNRDAARFYYEQLKRPAGQAVRAYLERRRILWKTAVKFGMGASVNAWDVLLNAMTAKGYSKQELLDAGLIVQNKKGGFYDKFRNRLMLPVIDTRGDVVAFGSRVLDGSEPKYMNSPETPVYSKRRVLYGLNLAKTTKRPNFILCEGNLDVVTLHQAGIDNAIASMGTALTDEQAALISRLRKKELIFCYDNDQAGETATERGLNVLRNADFTIRILTLPRRMENGKSVKQDPDDFIKYQGVDAFERLLSRSEQATEYRMAQTAKKYDLDSVDGRIAYTEEAGKVIASLENPVERDIYTQRAAELAGVAKEAMENQVKHTARREYARRQKADLRRELNPAVQLVQPRERSMRYENVRSARAEAGLIRILLMDESLFPEPLPLNEQDFSSPLLGKTFFLLWHSRQPGQSVSLHALSESLTPEEMSHIVSVCQEPESAEHARRALEDYINVVRQESEKRRRVNDDPLAAQVKRRRNHAHDSRQIQNS